MDALLTLSSKRQLVIPGRLRQLLGLSLETGCFGPVTVALELEWVLRGP
jgi:hypothetical protein